MIVEHVISCNESIFEEEVEDRLKMYLKENYELVDIKYQAVGRKSFNGAREIPGLNINEDEYYTSYSALIIFKKVQEDGS